MLCQSRRLADCDDRLWRQTAGHADRCPAVQAKAAPTVWNSGGCSSWYLDDAGRNTTLWPDYTFRFVRRTRSFNPDDYVLTNGTAAP